MSSRAALLADFWQATQFPLGSPPLTPTPQAAQAGAQDPPSVIHLSWPEIRLNFAGALPNPDAGLLTSEMPGGSGQITPWHALLPQTNKRPFDTAFSDEHRAPLAASRMRLMALPEIPALEAAPATSGFECRSSLSISDNVLRKTLLALSDVNTQTSDWFDTLESIAVDAALENGPYPDARHLLERLVRRLEAEQSIDPWPVAFERVVLLITRFEARTADAAKALLLTHDSGSHHEATLLASASTHTSIDRLIAHRLHAIAYLPAEHRTGAWTDLLAGLQRATAGGNAKRLVTLAAFICLLPAADQRKAANAIVTATCTLSTHDGWSELTRALLAAVPPTERVAIARAMVHPDRGLHGLPMKTTVAVIADQIMQIPRQAARDLLAHIIDIATMEGDFDYLVFSCGECIEMLHDLHAVCLSAHFDDLATHVHAKLVEALDDYRAGLLD